MTGIERIAAERKRQVEEEGWSPKHDDQHTEGEIAMAAGCYAFREQDRQFFKTIDMPIFWPWDESWWKPTPEDRVRELAKAGALAAAEIDRLLREAARAVG